LKEIKSMRKFYIFNENDEFILVGVGDVISIKIKQS